MKPLLVLGHRKRSILRIPCPHGRSPTRTAPSSSVGVVRRDSTAPAPKKRRGSAFGNVLRAFSVPGATALPDLQRERRILPAATFAILETEAMRMPANPRRRSRAAHRAGDALVVLGWSITQWNLQYGR